MNINDITIKSNGLSTAGQHLSLVEQSVNQFIEDLKRELQTIIAVSAKLSRFLRASSITVYNDDIIEYIRYFINIEEFKNKSGAQNGEVIFGLQATLKSYQEDMEMFKMAINEDEDLLTAAESNNDNGIPKTDEIFSLVETLYALPINGQSIREQVEGLKKSQTENVLLREQVIQLPVSVTSSSTLDRLEITLV